MAEKVGSVYYEIDADSTEFDKKLNQASGSFQDFGKKLTDTGQSLSLTVTAPILAMGGAAFKMASDFNESLNKVNVVFDEHSQKVLEFADNSLKNYGIAQGTALEMTSLFGDMATSMGFSQKEAAAYSTSLAGLAGDLASFKNIGVDEAMTALSGVFTGETESLKRLGIIMTESTLEAFALSKGLEKNWKDLDQSQKVAWRYTYAMEATKNAQGDFARTSEGAANQTRIMQESLKELSEGFGQLLLPIITPIITKINEFMQKIMALDEEKKKLIITVGLVVAAIGPLLIVLGAIISLGGTIATVIGAIASPIGIAVLAIAGIVAALFTLQQKFEIFTPIIEFFKSLFERVSITFDTFKQAIASQPVQLALDNIQTAFVKIGEALQPVFDKLKGLTGSAGEGSFFSLSSIIGVVSLLLDTLATIFLFVADSISVTIDIVVSIIDFFKKLWEKIQELINKGKEFGTSIQEVWNSFWLKVSTVNTQIKNAVQELINKIGEIPLRTMEYVHNFISIFASVDLYEIGEAMIQGLWDGMVGVFNNLEKWVSDKVDDLINEVKKILKISSPSKVFEEIGENVGLGFQAGVDGVMGGLALPLPTFSGQNTTETLNPIQSPLNINIGLGGILVKSKSDLRALGIDILNAVNDELRVRGREEIGGGNLGFSTF